MRSSSKLKAFVCCRDWLLIIGLLLPLALTPSDSPAAASELPGLGDGNAVINLNQERQLGQSWLRRLRAQVPLYHDPLSNEYLHDLIYRLTPNSELLDRDLSLIMVDSEELNAFAVPGGVIGVNAGLFLHAKTEQELSGVLAHELAHISQRHFARRLEDQNKHLALNMAGLLASVILAAAAGTDAGVAALASSQAFSIQEQLAYSRLNEQEADRVGIQTIAATGMNPQAMVSMFERMMQSQRFNRSVPEYLRTHPLTESRISDLSERARSLPIGKYRENVDFYFIQARIKTRYAANARDLFQHFHSWRQHSNDIIQQAGLYGEVLTAIRTKRPVEAKDALSQLEKMAGKRITVQHLRGEWLLALGQLEQAEEHLDQALRLSPGNYPLARLKADVFVEQRRYREAEGLMWQLTQDQPNDINLWYELAEVAGQANSIVHLHRARAEYYYLKANLSAAKRQLEQALAKSEHDYQQSLLIRSRLVEIGGSSRHFNF